MLPDGPITLSREGVRVAIRLSPRAKTDRLLSVVTMAEGRHAIKASVTAPPQDGRANEALLHLLSQAWRLPRASLAVIAGSAARNKTVSITGDPHQLFTELSGQIARLPSS
ncbi:MAG: DUF167 domain-containing protein [Acetobacteraceae bacterium]|nr:DUF167 domain-containing protein [Acetobacteraceae bacterium]